MLDTKLIAQNMIKYSRCTRSYGGKFDYSGLVIASTSTGYTITFKVANSGTIKATEIPQLYIGFPSAAGEPPKNLRGFEEVPLAVGASSTVTMTLSTREIRYITPCVPLVRLLTCILQRMGYSFSIVEAADWNLHSLYRRLA